MVKWQLGNYYRPCHAGRTIDELGSTSEQFYSGTDINMAGRSCLKHSPDQHFDAYGGSSNSIDGAARGGGEYVRVLDEGV